MRVPCSVICVMLMLRYINNGFAEDPLRSGAMLTQCSVSNLCFEWTQTLLSCLFITKWQQTRVCFLAVHILAEHVVLPPKVEQGTVWPNTNMRKTHSQQKTRTCRVVVPALVNKGIPRSKKYSGSLNVMV